MRIAWVVLALSFVTPAEAHDIHIDLSAGRAVLEAIADPGLDERRARGIARLAPNQMIVRKSRETNVAASEDRFVEELLATARGATVSGDALFGFDAIGRNRMAILATLVQLERGSAEFIGWLQQRIGAFSPRGPPVRLEGYLVAGGRATGFTFGGSQFYLNLAAFPDDAPAARIITAHELYHAVQSAAVIALGRGDGQEFDAGRFAALAPGLEQRRYAVEAFLYNLMSEGVATYVGDPALLTGPGRYSVQERGTLRGHLLRPARLTTLLDMSLIAITREAPLDYAAVYAVGFLSDQPLYYLGYIMARAIATRRGNARLGELVTDSGCEFLRDYLSLAAADPALPQPGSATRRSLLQYC